MNVAPYDVRQGNFVGANVNTVTRSGTNRFTGSVYTRYRNESFVGTEAAGQAFNPGTFKTTDTGEWVGGPIVKNKLFFFESFEKAKRHASADDVHVEPGRRAGGRQHHARQRVRPHGAQQLPVDELQLRHRSVRRHQQGSRRASRGWSRATTTSTTPTRSPSATTSSRHARIFTQNGSSALGTSRPTNTINFLSYQASNYAILENVKSGIGEWNSVFGKFTNNLLVGYTKQNESRDAIQLFPFVMIGDGNGGVLTSFGSEPFTPFNLLRYSTFQAQDSVTRFAGNHTFTFGGAVEKFHSDNSFYFGIQSAYSYASLADFYTDANSYIANPNRTVSPVTLTNFQVKYLLQPGQTTPPLQPLDVFYTSGYVAG